MPCASSRVQLGHHRLHSPMFVAGELGGTNVKMEGKGMRWEGKRRGGEGSEEKGRRGEERGRDR